MAHAWIVVSRLVLMHFLICVGLMGMALCSGCQLGIFQEVVRTHREDDVSVKQVGNRSRRQGVSSVLPRPTNILHMPNVANEFSDSMALPPIRNFFLVVRGRGDCACMKHRALYIRPPCFAQSIATIGSSDASIFREWVAGIAKNPMAERRSTTAIANKCGHVALVSPKSIEPFISFSLVSVNT